jgi:hypothetical protein
MSCSGRVTKTTRSSAYIETLWRMEGERREVSRPIELAERRWSSEPPWLAQIAEEKDDHLGEALAHGKCADPAAR